MPFDSIRGTLYVGKLTILLLRLAESLTHWCVELPETVLLKPSCGHYLLPRCNNRVDRIVVQSGVDISGVFPVSLEEEFLAIK